MITNTASASPTPDVLNTEVDFANLSPQSRRIFLRIHRQQLLAPVKTIRELCTTLMSEMKLQEHEKFIRDLEVISSRAAALDEMISELLDPNRDYSEGSNTDSTAHKANHDVRGLLTVVIGFSQQLQRGAKKAFLDDYCAELEQIEQLGHRLTNQIDDIVATLRGQPRQSTQTEASAIRELITIAEGLPDFSDQPAVHPGRILVVDDDEVVRGILAELLRDQGHEVVCIGDGTSALTLLKNAGENFDLVLLDILMPGANGFEILAEMKKHPSLSDIPVIVISGLSEMDEVVHCIRLGSEDYLTKPFNRVLLKARIDACLEKKRLRDQNDLQRKRYNMLLRDILPSRVVDQLAEKDRLPPQRHEDVAVLFADIVGFTSRCDHQPPEDVVRDLEDLFLQWEEIATGARVQKIKTIGDAFMAASGLLEVTENPVLDCVTCGLKMISATQQYRPGWNLRVGVHVGPVVAGVLGRRQYLYDLWGDTVNTASRMESNGQPGCVNLSSQAWVNVETQFCGVERKVTSKEVKGKGLIDIFHLSANDQR